MDKKSRIWELDAFRGLCILGVIVVHTIYDLQIFGLLSNSTPLLFNIIRDYGGLLFILISGICVTLGHHHLKRGIIVFLCGMLITGVTYGMYHLNLADKYILIDFGVLHLLGICMLFYALYRHLPTLSIAILGIFVILLAFKTFYMYSETSLTIPLGIIYKGYFAADYFPIIPYLGWFMVGTALGRCIYKKKQTLFPKFPADVAPVRFLSFCGRHSLWIYMGHQPIIYAIVYLIYSYK